ncbi:hypothetical protein [Streptomyces sp. 8N616]|uniref:hypothetical protein n=1 Tax=Streptomyces sp. 8N616 TaxID=3457414 RepID=UPI003FD59F32
MEIRRAGVAPPQVTRRLFAALDHLMLLAPAVRREPLLRHRALLEMALGRTLPDPAERQFSNSPDRQGVS